MFLNNKHNNVIMVTVSQYWYFLKIYFICVVIEVFIQEPSLMLCWFIVGIVTLYVVFLGIQEFLTYIILGLLSYKIWRNYNKLIVVMAKFKQIFSIICWIWKIYFIRTWILSKLLGKIRGYVLSFISLKSLGTYFLNRNKQAEFKR